MERIFRNCFVSVRDSNISIYPYIKNAEQLLEHGFYLEGYENVNVKVMENNVQINLNKNSKFVTNYYNFYGDCDWPVNDDIIVNTKHIIMKKSGFLWWQKESKKIAAFARWMSRKPIENVVEKNIFNVSSINIIKLNLGEPMQTYVDAIR